MRARRIGKDEAGEVGGELTGQSIWGGFKFGCGFALAVVVGLLAALFLLTALSAVAIFLGLKLPFVGG